MGHLAACAEQSDLSCAIVWVHSKCLCIVHKLIHIKMKVTEKIIIITQAVKHVRIMEIHSRYK